AGWIFRRWGDRKCILWRLRERTVSIRKYLKYRRFYRSVRQLLAPVPDASRAQFLHRENQWRLRPEREDLATLNATPQPNATNCHWLGRVPERRCGLCGRVSGRAPPPPD